MKMHWKKASGLFFILFLCCFLTAALAFPAGAQEEKVLVIEIAGAITPASDNVIVDAIEKAENEDFEALVISLDTPGGGL